MADTIKQANFQDAMDIGAGKILVNGEEWGFVTGVTVDGKAPEDLINCIGGTLRRRKPETVEWSIDSAVLYNNLIDLKELTRDGTLFQIVMEFENPDKNNSDNIGQVLTLNDCRVQDHSINVSDSSTFRMSGRARIWEVTSK